jgi:uncharacterized membrane protein
MTLDLSNDYIRGAVALVGVYLPMYALIKTYKVAQHPEYQTRTGYWTVGLLLVGSLLFYAFALDGRGRIILGGVSLILLAIMLGVEFFSNR